MINLEEKKSSKLPRFLMISSVPIILFISVLLGFINIIPLKVEPHSLIIVFLILFIFIFFIPHNAWYAYANYKNSLGETMDKIDKYLLENELLIANKKKSYGEIDSFFEEKLKTIRNDYFASIATSIFPTLGILGTFTAIAISMPNFSVESQAALENEITILLSGVGTAFYASIFGIFLSIWWVFFEKRGETKIFKDIEEMKLQYKDLIWSKDEIERYRIIEEQNRNQMFIEKVQNIITPKYVDRLDELVKEKIHLIEKIDRESKMNEQRLLISYDSLTKLFEDAKQKQGTILDEFKQLQESLHKTNDVLEQKFNEEAQNSKAIKSEIYSVLSSFELVSSDLKKVGQSLVQVSSQK